MSVSARGLGVLVAVGRLDDRSGRSSRSSAHDAVLLALVQVDRAGVHRLEGARWRRRCRPVVRRRSAMRNSSAATRCAGRCRAPACPARCHTARRRSRSTSRSSGRRAGARRRRGRRPTTARRRASAAARTRRTRAAAAARTGSRGSRPRARAARVKTRAGWAMSHWSSWSSPATSTATDRCVVRPARPACCHIEARVPGKPLSTRRRARRRRCRARARSWPRRRASCPSKSSASISRRSVGR